MNAKHHDVARDFNIHVRRTLLRRGLVIVGKAMGGGYEIHDRGTSKIRDYAQVRALGGAPVSYYGPQHWPAWFAAEV